MAPGRITEDNIERVVQTISWTLLALLSLGGLVFRSGAAAAGILAGGLIALGNFYWLKSVIRRALGLPASRVRRFALLRYVVRLAVIGMVLYLLIVSYGIDIFGLIIGLSVIVASIFVVTVLLSIQKGG
ncbi:MAG TPA: ATP synthase subunit I [Verrucomicrobiae bacterium]|nr:ATP synthase subunit I [Verrucomicrobiae bacterium]